jgi:hypothetical protein
VFAAIEADGRAGNQGVEKTKDEVGPCQLGRHRRTEKDR